LFAPRFFDPTVLAERRLAPGLPDPRGFQASLADTETGEPVRFNACEEIHYVINPNSGPADAIDRAHAAFRSVSAATGMRFVYDGTTSETPSDDRPSYQPDRYGDRWAPILLAWSSQPLALGAAGDIVGQASPRYEVNGDGRAVYVTGSAIFDATDDSQNGYRQPWDQVMLHEIAHLIGLDHVQDQTSVMFPSVQIRPTGFGEGDKAGLWALGLGSDCLSTPSVH
jgi:hypothetical protein